MCGIIGAINRSKLRVNGDKIRKWVTQALYADAFRGRHGTGLIGVDHQGIVSTYKRALASSDFLELPQTQKILEDVTNVFFIGHNRWATQGSHITANTHPFNHGHIHMVHNGTLDFYKSMTPGHNFSVDSEAIAYLLSERDSVKDVLEKLEGAYSLVWYDEMYETINFARNKERPMYFGRVEVDDSLLFASEKGMIEWIADRNGIELKDVYSVKTGVHLTIPLDPKHELTITEFTPKEKSIVAYDLYKDRGGSRHITSYTTNYKYGYLKDKESIIIRITDWCPYQSNATSNPRYGYVTSKYVDDLEVNISSVPEYDKEKYVGKLARVKINNFISDVKGFATLIEFVEEAALTNDKPIEGVDYSVEDADYSYPGEDDNAWDTAFLHGPRNTLLTMKEFQKRTKDGCNNCGDPIDWKDHEDLLWDNDHKCFCSSCTDVLVNNVIPFNRALEA